MSAYRHTQVGYLPVVALGILLFALVVLMAVSFHWGELAAFALLAVLLVLFGALTVEVDTEARLVARFGVGLIRKSFAVREIVSAHEVRNSPLCGWGIRLTSNGWLLNVSGLRAVELQMQNGRRYRIGSDEPAELVQAIHLAIGAARS